MVTDWKEREVRMKKWMILILVMCVFACAYSEEAPNGATQTVYFPSFDRNALQDLQYVIYPEKSGLLLSAYSDDSEITITVEQDEDAVNEEAFLAGYLAGITRYAAFVNEPVIENWESPDGKTGKMTQITYRHIKASEDGETFYTDAFCLKAEDMYLLTVFNSWAENAEDTLKRMEDAFFESFRLEKREVSNVYLAQVKNARADENGDQYVYLDFCTVVYDESIFTVYAQNKVEEKIEYRFASDALIWMPDTINSLYTMRLTPPGADEMIETSAAYYEKMGFDIIYQVMFNAENEIIWMMHYNAF
ncbi:MAG: hypothetical protein IJA93_01050 [Clostridia bacterium]|nr:hypothetical protein [Clostridia bacterium]